MNSLKRLLGVLWILAGIAVLAILVAGAVKNVDTAGTRDINNPVIWVIIIAIFTPISIGLIIFGFYAIKGEYDRLPTNSAEI
ncbi:MAG: hypothetical protein EOO05_12005 [Chitinophagaceae bacterium]|nr:MAG: hypothetical protein EOO05_12005 [Chitinophagaceae bacterium]